MSDDLRNSIECRETNIRHYFPDVLANAVEFNELANVVEPELNRIIKLLVEKALDTFVFDLDEDGARRWEKMLKLSPRNADTLDDRRMAILAKIMPNTPYTHRKLEILLDEICGEGKLQYQSKTQSVLHQNTDCIRCQTAETDCGIYASLYITRESDD